jgi:hypothetical protein
MATVITVVYETDKAIFQYTVDEVTDHLSHNEAVYDAKEVTALKDLLSSATADSITIPKDHRLFPHIALDLIKGSKGTAYCRICGKSHESAQLKPVTVGHGENPFSVNVKGKGCLRKLFGKKERLPLFGGKGYACPEGHELIAVMTWRTKKKVNFKMSIPSSHFPQKAS